MSTSPKSNPVHVGVPSRASSCETRVVGKRIASPAHKANNTASDAGNRINPHQILRKKKQPPLNPFASAQTSPSCSIVDVPAAAPVPSVPNGSNGTMSIQALVVSLPFPSRGSLGTGNPSLPSPLSSENMLPRSPPSMTLPPSSSPSSSEKKPRSIEFDRTTPGDLHKPNGQPGGCDTKTPTRPAKRTGKKNPPTPHGGIYAHCNCK